MTRYRFDQIAENSTAKKKPEESDRNRYVGLEHLDPGTLEVTRWGAEVTPKGDKLLMKKGDVLFGRRRAYQKKVGIAPFDGIFSAHGMVLRPKADVVDPMFFPFFISSDIFLDEAIRVSVGSLSPTANWKDLRTLEFDLPSPGKQRELAGILSEAESLKGHYRKLLTTCDDVVKSQFVEMFSDVGYTNPLEKLIIPNTRISYGIVQPGPGGTGDMGVLRPVDIVDGYLCLDEVKRIDEKIGYPYRRTELKGTEVLTVVRGATGQTVRSNASCIGMNVTRGIAVIRYDSRLIDPDYLVGYMNSNEGQRYIADHTKGATLQQINISDLKVMPIPVPSIRRQQQFAAFVTQVDKSKFAVQKALNELNATTKKILNQELGLGDV